MILSSRVFLLTDTPKTDEQRRGEEEEKRKVSSGGGSLCAFGKPPHPSTPKSIHNPTSWDKEFTALQKETIQRFYPDEAMNETVVRSHESHAHAPFPEEEGVRDSHPDIITYLVPRGEKQVRDAAAAAAAAAADPATTKFQHNT